MNPKPAKEDPIKERVFKEEFDTLYYFHGSTQHWIMRDFHFHKQHELILFLSDGVICEIGNRMYMVNAGDLLLINNKEYHRTNVRNGKSYDRYVLMFDPELLANMENDFDYDFMFYFENRPIDFVHKISLSGGNLNKVESHLQKIEQNISEVRDDEINVKIKLSILELLVTINGLYESFTQEKMEIDKISCENEILENGVAFKNPVLYRNKIEGIKKFIAGNVGEKLKLDEIASRFYINRYYLSHYFKKETGFTVGQYITNQKVIAAKNLLKQGFTVTEVSEHLAYNSESHFITVFKKATGITPKRYAKEKELRI